MMNELEARGYYVSWCDFPNTNALDVFRLDTNRYDLVVHLAYHVGGRRSIDHNKSALARNLQLDASLFEWAARTQQRRVLYFSSSAAYPVQLQLRSLHRPLAEEDIDLAFAREPDADYGQAKLMGERLAANAVAQGAAVTVVRPFSGYGADQSTDYPFRAFLERVKARESPFRIWGDPQSTRDWIHVSDIIDIALNIVDSGEAAPVNLCTGISTSFEKLATLFMETAGYQMPVIMPVSSEPMGCFHRVGNPTKMLQYGQPKVSLEEAIRECFS